MDRYKSECYILRHSYSSQKESAYTQVSEFRFKLSVKDTIGFK